MFLSADFHFVALRVCGGGRGVILCIYKVMHAHWMVVAQHTEITGHSIHEVITPSCKPPCFFGTGRLCNHARVRWDLTRTTCQLQLYSIIRIELHLEVTIALLTHTHCCAQACTKACSYAWMSMKKIAFFFTLMVHFGRSAMNVVSFKSILGRFEPLCKHFRSTCMQSLSACVSIVVASVTVCGLDVSKLFCGLKHFCFIYNK